MFYLIQNLLSLLILLLVKYNFNVEPIDSLPIEADPIQTECRSGKFRGMSSPLGNLALPTTRPRAALVTRCVRAVVRVRSVTSSICIDLRDIGTTHLEKKTLPKRMRKENVKESEPPGPELFGAFRLPGLFSINMTILLGLKTFFPPDELSIAKGPKNIDAASARYRALR